MELGETRWERLRTLFDQATALPTGQRGSFVDGSGADTDLRLEVASLLEADECQKKKPITAAIGAEVEANAEERRQRLVGSTVGDYRLLSVIGHGGTGTVYLAERLNANGDAKVAIKVVEGAATNATAKRRFRDERQILANLSHPYIARLFDAGDTTHGYPYLVMDYVDGEPIDRYCDRRRLTIRQRIELFLKVCEAVEYAHRNLVIHRDLKPQNILVTKDGTPKLLDFGIAKLLAERNQHEIAVTRFQDQLLTPAYASPEQILGKLVSTSSDVYTLGVVLCELLTGCRPYDYDESTSYLQYERHALTTGPRSPSLIIQNLIGSAAQDSECLLALQRISARRSATTTRLRLSLKGDLDSIVLHALQSQVQDRYESVEQLQNDLRGYLSHRPIETIEHNWRYVGRRFIKRNGVTVAIFASFVGILLIALTLISSQARQLATQRDEAIAEKHRSDAAANFMLEVFSLPNEATKELLAQDLLDNAAGSIKSDLYDLPSVRARLLEGIGKSYRAQGRAEISINIFQEAVATYRKLGSSYENNLSASLRMLGKAQNETGAVDSARQSLLESIEILKSLGLTESSGFGNTLADLGRVENNAGNLRSARQYFDRAIPILRKSLGPKHVELGTALMSLAYAAQWEDDYKTMEKAAREALSIYEVIVPEINPDRIQAVSTLAECLFDQGRINEAAPLIEKVVIDRVKIFGDTSTTVAHDQQLLVELRRFQNRYPEAEVLAKRQLNIRLQHHGEDGIYTAYALTTLGSIRWKLGKLAEADADLRSAINTYKKILRDDHPYVMSAEYYLAEVLLSRSRDVESLDVSQGLLQKLTQTQSSPWRISRAENVIGATLFAQRKFDEAQPLLEHSYEVLSTSTGPDRDTVQLAEDRLERFYVARHSREKLAALRERDSTRQRLDLSSAR